MRAIVTLACARKLASKHRCCITLQQVTPQMMASQGFFAFEGETLNSCSACACTANLHTRAGHPSYVSQLGSGQRAQAGTAARSSGRLG
jgi:hypothetical protein